MPDPKDALVGVRFHHGSPPYEAGDVAGFPRATADLYVASGRAAYLVPQAAPSDGSDPFAGLSRAELIAYARDHFGLVEPPPATISDDEIRDALRARLAAASDEDGESAPPAPPPNGGKTG